MSVLISSSEEWEQALRQIKSVTSAAFTYWILGFTSDKIFVFNLQWVITFIIMAYPSAIILLSGKKLLKKLKLCMTLAR